MSTPGSQARAGSARRHPAAAPPDAVAPRPDGGLFGVVLHRPPAARGLQQFHVSLLSGIEETLDRQGAEVLVQMVDSDREELAAYPRWVEADLVDGVVLLDLTEEDPRPALLHRLGLPGVVLGEAPSGTRLPVVEVDNGDAMRLALGQLLALGHRRIGRVSGPRALLHTRARGAAFEAVLGAAGLTGRTVEGDYFAASGASATRELLEVADRPTAIVYDNDLMAVAGLAVAAELGVRVPEQLSLLAWDDSAECRLARPPLSVVNRDIHALGVALAEVLLDLHAGRAAGTVQSASARVVIRGTVAAPPS